jgi:hypothetical protein
VSRRVDWDASESGTAGYLAGLKNNKTYIPKNSICAAGDRMNTKRMKNNKLALPRVVENGRAAKMLIMRKVQRAPGTRNYSIWKLPSQRDL